MTKQVRDQVFLSYSNKDQKWLKRLQTTLMPLVRQGAVRVWADTEIRAGAQWKYEIENALATAKVAVLLVSQHFLASEFIVRHELPPLLKAAKEEGAKIIWIAVSASLYEETEIADYQPANDPTKPLDSLRPADLNKELVRIAQKIKWATEPSGDEPHRTGGADPASKVEAAARREASEAQPAWRRRLAHIGEVNLGRFIPKMCDRDLQEIAFTKFLKENQELRPGFPQVYFIHGEEGECHNSLVERLAHTRIRELAGKNCNEQMSVVDRKPLAWVCHGERADLQQELGVMLFEEFSYPPYKGELSPSAFCRLASRLLTPVIVIQHTIPAAKWTNLTRGLIKWYLSFWAEVGKSASCPQFIVFLNIVYPGRSSSARWKNWLIVKHIKNELQKVIADSKSICPCSLIEELSSVEQHHIQDWFITYGAHTEKAQYDLLHKMFPSRHWRATKSRKMADVEHYLQDACNAAQQNSMRTRGY